MNRRRFLLSAAASISLAACTPSGGEGQSATATRRAPRTLDELISATSGFWVGPPMAAARIVVLFDPQCPHCGNLWRAAEALHGKARMLWVPVAILNRSSAAQGAALLAAPNSIELMTSHETLLSAGRGGITAMGTPDPAALAKVKANSEVFRALDGRSVPLVFWAGKDGALASQAGPSVAVLEGVVATARQ